MFGMDFLHFEGLAIACTCVEGSLPLMPLAKALDGVEGFLAYVFGYVVPLIGLFWGGLAVAGRGAVGRGAFAWGGAILGAAVAAAVALRVAERCVSRAGQQAIATKEVGGMAQLQRHKSRLRRDLQDDC